ncbi:hypothetical protein D9M72_394810 [compost metagenome]
MRGIEEVDDRREHLPDQAARALDDGVGRRVAAAAGLPHVEGIDAPARAQAFGERRAFAGFGRLHRHARDRGARRHRLDAAQVAAVAARAFLVDADVAHVAGRAGRAAVHLAVADDAAADARADLDHKEVRERAPQPPQLAERHQVDVVVDEHGRRVVFAQVVADREAVPGRHERRVHELADLEVDGAGHADADAQHVPWALSAAGQQFAHEHAHTGQHHGRAFAHVGGFFVLGEHREVGAQHRDVEAGGADVDADEHAEFGIELEVFGAATARGALQAGLGQQALVDEAGDQAVGLALGEAQLFGHGMARAAGRPEGRFQQPHFVGRDAAPGCHAFVSALFGKAPVERSGDRSPGEGEY